VAQPVAVTAAQSSRIPRNPPAALSHSPRAANHKRAARQAAMVAQRKQAVVAQRKQGVVAHPAAGAAEQQAALLPAAA
jgi:hypothetical protein